MSAPSVFIAGPVSWNTIIVLDRLPEPEPHMQFAEASWETIGGTSAGKALSLTSLDCPTTLYALAGDDEHGRRLRAVMDGAGIDVLWGRSGVTERHVNLMTRAGERVSLYLATPSAQEATAPTILAAMAAASVLVLDLAAEPLRLLPDAIATGTPIWVDVHDYDGETDYHRPFLTAADAVFCNADRLADPVAFLRAQVARGASFAVCTLGAEGAIAVDAEGTHRIGAVPAAVLDTNGAGDGFFAGVLAAHLAGAPLVQALENGARTAATVLATRHLHPVLDPLIPGASGGIN